MCESNRFLTYLSAEVLSNTLFAFCPFFYSASVNHERIVRACRKEDLRFEPYDQDEWVADQHYNERTWADLLLLWKMFNLHIADVMESIPDAIALRKTKRHNFHRILFRDISDNASVNLLLLCKDYVAHLQHHIESLLAERR